MTDSNDPGDNHPALSLHEIETTVCRLWVDGKYRRRAFGDRETSADAGMQQSELDLLNTIDRKAINLYAWMFRQRFLAVMNCVYPSCAKLFGNEWSDLVDSYFEICPPKEERLNWVARNFSGFLQKRCDHLIKRFPFIIELVDYEWTVRMVLDKEVDIRQFPHDPLVDRNQLQSLRPVINPTLEIRVYRYPIPLIADRLLDWCNSDEMKESPMCMLLYRDPESHEYKVLDVGKVTGRLVEVALSTNGSYEALFAKATELTQQGNYREHLGEFIQIVDYLQAKRVFVGSKAASQ